MKQKRKPIDLSCKICGQEADWYLCDTCLEFIQWQYPHENPEDILKNYRKLLKAHFYLKQRRRS